MAVLETIVLAGLMLQSLPAGDPQAAPTTSSGPRDPALDRIRSRLAEPPPITVPASTPLFRPRRADRPLFEVQIDGFHMPPWDWLDTGTTIPGYVRPTYPPTHHEFMLSVTPEMFRAVAVHPHGVPVLSIARGIAKATRGPLRRSREARARREVAEALRAFETSTSKRPGQ